MLEKLIEDLRFIIGALFGIFGVILLIVSAMEPIQPGALPLNFLTGAFMSVFSVFMLGTSIRCVLVEERKPAKAKAKVV